MTQEAFICDAVRTSIGRYAGALATVRTDDLAAAPISALALGHPLGMSGARMVLTATWELERRKSKAGALHHACWRWPGHFRDH